MKNEDSVGIGETLGRFLVKALMVCTLTAAFYAASIKFGFLDKLIKEDAVFKPAFLLLYFVFSIFLVSLAFLSDKSGSKPHP
jgi:hypothetical protein